MNRRQILLASVASLLPIRTAQADDEYIDLSEEPSRADLFRTQLREPENAKSDPNVEPGALAIPDDFLFPRDAVTDRIENKPRKNSLFGIDISHYTDSNIKLASLREQEIHFVQVKASQGTKYRDKMFPEFWKRLGDLPDDVALTRGAYHFLSSDGSGKRQAENLLAYLEKQGGPKQTDMPLTMDLEWDPRPKQGIADAWAGKGHQYIVDTALEFLNEIENKTGKRPIIYTCTAWFSSSTLPMARFNAFQNYHIWIADYSKKRKLSETPKTPLNSPAVSWQFTDMARITNGHSGGIDASIFYGTESEFKEKFDIR